MVMEASPSPQIVGREFVRQYYTLLNKAPAHLHRFYNNYSSFVHGGLDAPNRETLPVIGQKQIHNRIQQLNFRDCHAKISQVDSQATLGNGVVVQVTGELSNCGAPMRRFTQTFVLAAQSPKKFYVHNDIFRYQDIVFSDEEAEGDVRSEGEEEPYFPPAPAAPSALSAPFPPAPPAPLHPLPPQGRPFEVVLGHLNGHPQEDANRQLVAALQATSLPTDEELDRERELECEREKEREREREREREQREREQRDAEEAKLAQEEEVEELVEAEEPAQPVLPPAAPEPKTYANLLKSGGGISYAQPRPQPTQPAVVSPTSIGASSRPAAASSPPEAQPPRGPRAPRPPRNDPAPPSVSEGPNARRYSDSQQLFLGNVPHNATEDELRALFGRFGAIADLRIHSKPGSSSGGGPRHPNYGFITYEEAQSAQNCLHSGALYFPPDSTDGHKLNVEEKKTRTSRGGGEGAPRGVRGGGARPPPSHRPPFPSRLSNNNYRR